MTSEHESVDEHVLIVDGDEQFASDIVGAVLNLGFGASSAASAAEAISGASRPRPTLVVVDVDVEGPLRGIRLAESLRRHSGSAIVLMTTRTDRDMISAIAAVDPDGVLCKPFHWRQFEVTLRLALNQRPDSFEPTTSPQRAGPIDTSRSELEGALRRIAVEVARVGFGNAVAEFTPNQEWLAAMRPREREVVTLLLQHQRVPAIARTLSISPATVRNHLKSVFRQMGVHSQQELLLVLRRPSPQQPRGISDQPPKRDA